MADAPKGPISPFSARPSSLEAPVPGKQEALTADSLLASLDTPQPTQAAIQKPTADSMLQSLDSASPAPAGQGEDFPIQEPSSFLGFNTDIVQQVKDANDRIAGKIAGDPRSLQLTLENRLGKENVRVKGDKVYYKHAGDKGFREFDPKTFEIVNDLFSDNVKEIFQAMGATGGALAGAGAGPVGVVAGGALGASVGTSAANAYGERMMGVVRAPETYTNQEPGVKGDIMRGLERTGEDLSTGAEYEAYNQAFKFLGQKWTDRRARIAGLKKLAEVPPADQLQESVKANMETLGEMKSLGLTRKIEGTDIEVPAHQLLPYMPEVEKAAKSVGAEAAFQNAQKEAAENFGAAALNLAEEASSVSRGTLSNATRSGVPAERTTTAEQINGLFRSVRKAEGAVIAEFRDRARATAESAPLPAPKTSAALNDVFNGLGITTGKAGKLVFPQDDALAQMLGTDSKAFVGGLKADLLKLNDKLAKSGGLTVDELIGQSQIIGAKNDGARQVSGTYKSIIGKLSSALREDSRNGVQMALSPEDAAQYAAKMKRFSGIASSMDQLENYLRDDIGMNTFARGLVNKGKEGLPNLRAAKEFLLQENPDMYKGLIGQYMEELALKHRNPSEVAGFNPAGMRKDLASLGSEYLDELFPTKGPLNKSLVLRSFDLADQIQRTAIKGTDAELLRDAKKAAAALSWYHRGVNTVYALMNFGTKDNRLLKLLSREGVESFLTEVPKQNREGMRQVLKGAINLGVQRGILSNVNYYNQPDTKPVEMQP